MVNEKFISPYGRVRDLKRPDLNVRIADVYLAYLLNREEVARDVLKMLLVYDAGYKNLEDWQKTADAQSDQLLFLESIPAEGTRVFLDRVLRSYLIYRLKNKQTLVDFQEFARGGNLIYVPRDRIGSLPD